METKGKQESLETVASQWETISDKTIYHFAQKICLLLLHNNNMTHPQTHLRKGYQYLVPLSYLNFSHSFPVIHFLFIQPFKTWTNEEHLQLVLQFGQMCLGNPVTTDFQGGQHNVILYLL